MMRPAGCLLTGRAGVCVPFLSSLLVVADVPVPPGTRAFPIDCSHSWPGSVSRTSVHATYRDLILICSWAG